MDAYQLLDHNCWRFVFRKLDAEDLLSCSLVCRPFSELLDEERFQRRWKFELILPILFPYLKAWDWRWDVETWVSLRNIRLVCQSWRESVDKYASEIFEPTFFSHPTKYCLPLATCFKSSEKIGEFHEKFGEYNGNPFPAKTVFISRFYEPGDINHHAENVDPMIEFPQSLAYIEKVTNFAEQFGRNIFKLELKINLQFFNTDCFFVCNLIKRVSMHLPHLKTFRVKGKGYEDRGERLRDIHQLATWIEQNELSDLPQLQALEICGLNEKAEDYLVEKYASQITHFQRTYNFPENILMQFQPQLFGNLRKLSLQLKDHDYVDALEPLRLLQSPLKILKLIICRDDFNNFPLHWNVANALRNLQHLPIECLKIRLHPHVNMAEAGLDLEEYVNESIQTLSVHFIYVEPNEDGEISFNFLRALTKLEKLKLKFKRWKGKEGAITHPEGLPEEVTLHEYLTGGEGTDMIYHSNVWEKVASLKTLIVKRDLKTWTRHEPEPGNIYLTNGPHEKSISAFTRKQYELVRRNENALNEINEFFDQNLMIQN